MAGVHFCLCSALLLHLERARKQQIQEVLGYEIEEGLSSIRVPRLILQPLVENSIYHGIRPKGEHGVIRVTVKRQEDFLFL